MKDEVRAESPPFMGDEFSRVANKTLTIDVAKYQEYLDGADMTPKQKEDYLRAVWTVVMTFVELGFGVHPLQEVWGKDGDNRGDAPINGQDAVCLSDPKKLTR
ncbi:hypothetical protein MALG_01478 [Marinovum algicola DG 898]|nr:hypothetical protein MALG_01478 [Marinovum algicola DG 898]